MLAAAGPAEAKTGDDRIVISGPVTIAPGQDAGDVVVANGDVTVLGRVTGDLVVVNGTVRIRGRVDGDVTAISDRVLVGPRARVGGDVAYADKKPVVAPGARITGDVKRVDVDKATGGLGLAAGLGLWLAVSVSALLLGLLLLWALPRAAAAVYETADARTGRAIVWGLVLFFGIPILALILLVSLVGLPLGLLLLLALLPLYALGYTASAWVLGRRILGPPRSRFLAFLAGLAILRVLALIPIVGGLVWFAATVFGLGLLLIAARRGRMAPVTAEAPAPA